MTPGLESLPEIARTGSRARCVLLTHGSGEEVARRLTKLIEPFGNIEASHTWTPGGFDNPAEAQLDKTLPFLTGEQQREIQSWWLASTDDNPRTPNWDIASQARIDGREGLVLIEAKAHANELSEKDSTGASEPNRESIARAIQEANSGLDTFCTGFNLRHDSHYQLSNRFAWSWKVATMGIPVILVYLGFLGAIEMDEGKKEKVSFDSEDDWRQCLLDYGKETVPSSVWNTKLDIGGTPLIPLIRSLNQPLA